MLGFGRKTVDPTAVITAAVERVVARALGDAESALKLTTDITELRQKLEKLKIEKDRQDEQFKAREREIEHKVGLERKRQEFEIQQAKREAQVSIREENLKADRERFDEQLKFHEDRFTSEVGYLKDILTKLMERLPEEKITTTRRR